MWSVEESNSGGSDIFGVLGDLLNGAKETLTGYYEVVTAKDQLDLERDRLKAAAAQQGTVYSATADPFPTYTGSSMPFDYQKWGFIVAAIAAFVVVFNFVADRKRR